MKGFKDYKGKFHPTENKVGIRMKREKTTKTHGVRIKSVTLKPTSIQKVNRQIVKDLNAGESTNFSSALNKVVDKARLDRDENGVELTRWKVVLEDPRRESGTRTHVITLGKKATVEDVRNAILRLQEDGEFLYYEKDLQFPYLHSIKQIK